MAARPPAARLELSDMLLVGLTFGSGAVDAIDWIPSGVPISQPQPHVLSRELLAERGLHLFEDSSVDPCTRNRHRIGYACANAELIKLAHLVRDHATKAGIHPVTLATQWIAAARVHYGARLRRPDLVRRA